MVQSNIGKIQFGIVLSKFKMFFNIIYTIISQKPFNNVIDGKVSHIKRLLLRMIHQLGRGRGERNEDGGGRREEGRREDVENSSM